MILGASLECRKSQESPWLHESFSIPVESFGEALLVKKGRT